MHACMNECMNEVRPLPADSCGSCVETLLACGKCGTALEWGDQPLNWTMVRHVLTDFTVARSCVPFAFVVLFPISGVHEGHIHVRKVNLSEATFERDAPGKKHRICPQMYSGFAVRVSNTL